jgi:hypothetical protein
MHEKCAAAAQLPLTRLRDEQREGERNPAQRDAHNGLNWLA